MPDISKIKLPDGSIYNLKSYTSTAQTFVVTIASSDWINNVYIYTNNKLRCDNPPIISCIENQKEYSNITNAIASKGSITFSISNMPNNAMTLTIIDL